MRVSGPHCLAYCKLVTGITPLPRHAHNTRFRAADGASIDFGLTVFFPTPHSFTGEDVCEFHTHGSPVVVDQLLATLLQHGARMARPGEFSERAFVNDKLDLTQAEAIADLISSNSVSAARKALRSLQGVFSELINTLVKQIIELRIFVEASIDFPEEEVDFLTSGGVHARLTGIRQQLAQVLEQARQGAIAREGIRVVIAGEPNAGKSTLLNALAGMETAIVTDIPGTTRDILRQELSIDGLPVHIADTAGLRDSADPVEQEGIRRAWAAIEDADRILLVVDARTRDQLDSNGIWKALRARPDATDKLTVLFNKIDLAKLAPGTDEMDGILTICLSAREGQGLPLLRAHLRDCAGYSADEEGGFIARRRHLDALHRAMRSLELAEEQLLVFKAGELVAEELRNAQQHLGEITGVFTSDDLLGAIFSSFCIGK